MQQLSMQDTFSEIYQNRKWYKGSGSGSLVENTASYRQLLQELIDREDVTSVIDLGCGDWQFSKLLDWSTVQYTGIDVVPEVIQSNNQLYGDIERVSFACKDMLQEQPKADLLIVKDVLQHWSNEDIQQILQQLKDCKYVLITNSIRTTDISDPKNEIFNNDLNHDIARGGLHSIDITKAPFYVQATELLRYESKKRHAPFKDTKSVVLIEPGNL